jgi:hypothetical protein
VRPTTETANELRFDCRYVHGVHVKPQRLAQAERRLEPRKLLPEVQQASVLALGRGLRVEPLDRPVRRTDDPLELAPQPRPRRLPRNDRSRQQRIAIREQRPDLLVRLDPRGRDARVAQHPEPEARSPAAASSSTGSGSPWYGNSSKRPSSIASRICRSTIDSQVGPTESLPSTSRRLATTPES